MESVLFLYMHPFIRKNEVYYIALVLRRSSADDSRHGEHLNYINFTSNKTT